MCGITGFVSRDKSLHLEGIIQEMANLLTHRGPDNEGFFIDQNEGIALGHRRLSILDLSESGNQPMITACGQYILVYNGEIYNHPEIRKRLSFSEWNSTSDTETLLYAIREWGIEKTMQELNGMFAIAIFNKHKKRLYLARDRMGIKPIYFGKRSDCFIFSSELKPIIRSKNWDAQVDKKALQIYLKLGFIPAPGCILKDVYKLMPGSFLVFDIESFEIKNKVQFWSLKEVAQDGIEASQKNTGYKQNLENLEHLLSDSVNKRMLSDVPLGTFLSGGYDSSLITALAQKQFSGTLNTYSIGFTNEEYDESVYAEQVANHLGTNHTSQILDEEDCLNIVPKLSQVYDEPFADSSQIPTHLVSLLASNHVRVILSSDGADELFAGYNRHFLGDRIWSYAEKIPHIIRSLLGGISSSISSDLQERILHFAYPKSKEVPHLTTKIEKLNRAIQAVSFEELYHELIITSSSYGDILNDGNGQFSESFEPIFSNFQSAISYFAFRDMMQALPDDMLVKVDRASMACGLEVRVPFLDHRLVEYSWQIPFSQKIKNGEGKWILKQLAYKYIPEKLLDRPKKGFEVPIAEWLRGELKEWAEELLFNSTPIDLEIWNHKVIQNIWNEHQREEKNHKDLIWAILMYRAWENEYKEYLT